MREITEDEFQNAIRPMTTVRIGGNFGIIREVSFNACQPEGYIQYSVEWVMGDCRKVAWFSKDNFDEIGANVFEVLAECMCHPFGNNEKYVKKLLGGVK